jgi:hypothetical protein
MKFDEIIDLLERQSIVFNELNKMVFSGGTVTPEYLALYDKNKGLADECEKHGLPYAGKMITAADTARFIKTIVESL